MTLSKNPITEYGDPKHPHDNLHLKSGIKAAKTSKKPLHIVEAIYQGSDWFIMSELLTGTSHLWKKLMQLALAKQLHQISST